VFRIPKSEIRNPKSEIPVHCSLFTVHCSPFSPFPGSSPPRRRRCQQTITPLDTIRFEAETGWLGTTSAADYLPRAVQELPPADSLIPLYETTPPDGFIPRLDASQLPPGFTLHDQQERYTATT
jgi:hypothetical protein